ncbi:MAG: ROK family protein [Pirellulales bacterium]|nr:ROK family protein [Pirellulales bacterium]
MSQSRQFISRQQAQGPFFAGVDLGGTNIKVGVVDDQGRPMSWLSLPTETQKGPEDGARRMAEAVKAAARQAGLEPGELTRVGLGSPGTMDVPAGMLLQPHNLPGWFEFPIRDRLSAHCGLPVSFVNDANAAAYGEFWVGSGREFHSMVLFTLGTGVGCGVIVGDLLLDGENSHGAECGHIIVNHHEDARLCPCGQPGHLEAYASATALIRRAEESLKTRRDSSLHAALQSGDELSPLLVAREAERGDELARELVLDTARYLGVGIVTLMHTIDPNGVVLGGAMTFGGHENPLGREFLARVMTEVQRRAFPVLASRIKIDYATLGGDAGYIGAAGVARLHAQRAPG